MSVETNLLKTACYFSPLEPGALEAAKPYIRERRLASGEVLVRQGEGGETVYFIISGLLKLVATSSEGREFIVRLSYGGDAVNDDGLFDRGTTLLGASAMSPVLLYSLRWEDLERLKSLHPEINTNIARTFAARQRYLIRLATELVFKGVTARLARLLLNREHLSSKSGTSDFRITQQEMAAMIGTVREIVSRSIRELEGAGAIKLERNRIVITDRTYLEMLSVS